MARCIRSPFIAWTGIRPSACSGSTCSTASPVRCSTRALSRDSAADSTLVWNVSGGVTLRVTRVGPYNAIVEGIFFGTANSTSAMLTTPSNGATYVAPANVVLNATASTTSGTISKVEFFQDTTKLGEDLTSPYTCYLVERTGWHLFPDGESHEQRWRDSHLGARADSGGLGICRSVVRTLRYDHER